ncbi:unnamed protein product [Symbiodinium sp. KB8]|nr:unnamed protein product [Symbiodinium sp. KB8]
MELAGHQTRTIARLLTSVMQQRQAREAMGIKTSAVLDLREQLFPHDAEGKDDDKRIKVSQPAAAASAGPGAAAAKGAVGTPAAAKAVRARGAAPKPQDPAARRASFSAKPVASANPMLRRESRLPELAAAAAAAASDPVDRGGAAKPQ